MACYYCRHFDELEECDRKIGIIESVRLVEGKCTLSPTWETVTGLHYCSQFSPKDASDIGGFWQRMHQNSCKADEERERRLNAEKKLKSLRASIRAAEKDKAAQ